MLFTQVSCDLEQINYLETLESIENPILPQVRSTLTQINNTAQMRIQYIQQTLGKLELLEAEKNLSETFKLAPTNKSDELIAKLHSRNRQVQIIKEEENSILMSDEDEFEKM